MNFNKFCKIFCLCGAILLVAAIGYRQYLIHQEVDRKERIEKVYSQIKKDMEKSDKEVHAILQKGLDDAMSTARPIMKEHQEKLVKMVTER